MLQCNICKTALDALEEVFDDCCSQDCARIQALIHALQALGRVILGQPD